MCVCIHVCVLVCCVGGEVVSCGGVGVCVGVCVCREDGMHICDVCVCCVWVIHVRGSGMYIGRMVCVCVWCCVCMCCMVCVNVGAVCVCEILYKILYNFCVCVRWFWGVLCVWRLMYVYGRWCGMCVVVCVWGIVWGMLCLGVLHVGAGIVCMWGVGYFVYVWEGIV